MTDSALKAQIAEEIKVALKAGDKVRLGALRLLSAAVKNREVEVLHELSDDEVREVAAKEVKKRTESIEAFEGGGRQDLADREREEREILVVYAPEQLPDDTVDAMIDRALTETGATTAKDLGKVMGAVMREAGGRVDGTIVQRKVRARLGDG